MSEDETVWYYPNRDINTLGSEIPRADLSANAYAPSDHITSDGRHLLGYVAPS